MSEAIQTKQPKTVAMQLQDLLAANTKAITSLVPEHLTPERLMRIAVNCVAKTPALQKCTPTSLLRAVLAAAEVGLEPGGVHGEFYLVPFGTEVTPIIGYRGFAELVRRSGCILGSPRAVVVYEKDIFEVTEGIEQTITHKRYLAGDPGPLKFVYSVVRMKDGTVSVEIMSKAEVDHIRTFSKTGSNPSGMWALHYNEAAKKTVFRRHVKWLPVSSEDNRLEKAMELDNEDFVDGEVVAANQAVTSELTSVKERVGGKRKMLIHEAPALDIPAEEPPPPSEPPAGMDSTA